MVRSFLHYFIVVGIVIFTLRNLYQLFTITTVRDIDDSIPVVVERQRRNHLPLKTTTTAAAATTTNSDSHSHSNSNLPHHPAGSSTTMKDTTTHSRSSLQCRLDWDNAKKWTLINAWLGMELPILIGAIRHNRNVTTTIRTTTDNPRTTTTVSNTNNNNNNNNPGAILHDSYYKYTNKDIVYIIFTQRPHQQSGKIQNFRTVDWICVYGNQEEHDDNNNDVHDDDDDAKHPQEPAILAPYAHRKKSDDVIVMCNATVRTNSTFSFPPPTNNNNDHDKNKTKHANDDDNEKDLKQFELIGVQALLPSAIDIKPTITTTTLTNKTKNATNSSNVNINNINSNSNTAYVYNVRQPLRCDRYEEEETWHIHKSKTIGACLRFRGVRDREHVPEWIEYHRVLGVEHFWIYTNEEWNMTGLYEASYITYLPFDFTWSSNNHAHYFPYEYKNPSGYAFFVFVCNHEQTTASNNDHFVFFFGSKALRLYVFLFLSQLFLLLTMY